MTNLTRIDIARMIRADLYQPLTLNCGRTIRRVPRLICPLQHNIALAMCLEAQAHDERKTEAMFYVQRQNSAGVAFEFEPMAERF